MSFDPYGQPTTVFKPRSPAPIVLLVVLLLASGGGNYWLWKERQRATSEANATISKLTAAEAAHKEMSEKLDKLQTENAELAEAKQQLSKDVEAKSGELARLKDDIAGVEPPADDKAQGDKADKKSEASAKDDKKGDKKADKKSDAKADSKADSKAKKKASSSARKKDKDSARTTDKPAGDREL